VSVPRSQLVRALMVFIRRYVVVSREQLLIVSLWILHTHVIEHVEQTPYLAVTSPEKRCGKTTLLEVVAMLSARSWATVLPSEAVVYRKVSADCPTLLLDECDAIFNPRSADKYEGLRALLNGGNRRGVTVPRCVGPKSAIVEFKVFCPKLLAGIGSLPDTVADRSVPVRLMRKKPDERTRQFKRRDVEPIADALRERVEAWAAKHGEEVEDARPTMPEMDNSRAQDGCECLIGIADMLGCGVSARKALVSLFEGERADDTDSMRMTLLRDLRDVWEALGDPRSVSTHTLLDELRSIEESPWRTWYGREFDARDLAALLGHYNIASKTVYVRGDESAKGYKRDDLYEVWERYL
jgi:hypothetical protein